MKSGRLLVVLALAGLAAGCAASGKAVVDQYQQITPNRFEGAVAVVLESRDTAKVDDKGESLVSEGFRRVKIMDRKAMDCGQDDPNCRIQRFVCYNETWDEVEFIKARTITPEGEVLEVDKDDMSDRTFTTWAVPDQDQRCYVWMAKGVSKGAILEEHWRIRSKKILGAGGFWFQDQDPVLYAEFTLDTPADYDYKWKLKNIDIKPTEKKVGNRLIRTWTAKDVSPLIREENMVAPDDVVAQLKIANSDISAFGDYKGCRAIKSWEDMGRCWNEMLIEQQKITPAIKEVAEKIAAKAKTETEKVKEVWRYLNENVRYVGLERGLAGFIPLSAHVVCSKKYGDCKAVAGLISVLCRQMGMKADPILIGTRPQLGALDTDLPGPFHFNHSIARVEADGKVYWLDATGRYDSFETTQARNQGVNVVVANPEKPFLDFIPVQPPEMNTSVTKAVFTPSGDGEMMLDVQRTSTGNSASGLRAKSYTLNQDKWNKWVEWYISQSYPSAAVTEQSLAGKEDNNAPFELKVKAKIPRALQSAGKGVSFEVKELFPSGIFEDFSLPKRRYALDLGYKWTRTNRFEVQIPKGMQLSGMPKNVAFEDDYIKVERMSQIENDRVVTLFTWVNKVYQIPADKYVEARKSFQKVLDASNFVVMFEPEKKKSS